MDSENQIDKLIIAPHADDEVLGCGGILDKATFVYYCGLDESEVQPDPTYRVPLKERVEEIKRVSNFFGFKYEINYKTKVNNYKITELISAFEAIINKLKPNKIFIPFPSYNQDHKVVYDAVQVALRPHDKNFFVKKVLVYEQDQAIIWEHKNFKINYFVPIDVEKKIEGYLLHASQVRKMRSPELLRVIAKLRGFQSNYEHAEAFTVERWVE